MIFVTTGAVWLVVKRTRPDEGIFSTAFVTL